MEKKINNLFGIEIDEQGSNEIYTDIRAEVLAAALIEKGADPDLIKIVRDRAFQRNWTKDIESVDIEYSQTLLKDELIIKTNRAGIYDILPENIFHRTAPKNQVRDKESVIEEIREQRKEEYYARKFFKLFESVVDDFSIQAYLYEAQFDKRVSNPHFINIFLSYWPILELLERPQAIIFLQTIPLLNKIRTNLLEIADAMSLILNTKISIEKVYGVKQKSNPDVTKGLGKQRLAIDWIVGETFNDGLIDLKIKIGPIPAYYMINYIEKSSKGYIIVDYLCNLFFQANTNIEKEFIVSSEDATFYLSDDNHNTYLGINTFL